MADVLRLDIYRKNYVQTFFFSSALSLLQQDHSITTHDAETNGNATEPTFAKQEHGVDERFLVSGRRLERFIPIPPHKRAKKSCIWQAGVGLAVTKVKNGKKFWLCCRYYDNPMPQPLFLVETNSTTPAIRHLQGRHKYDEKGCRHEASGQKRKRDSEDIRDALKRLRDAEE